MRGLLIQGGDYIHNTNTYIYIYIYICIYVRSAAIYLARGIPSRCIARRRYYIVLLLTHMLLLLSLHAFSTTNIISLSETRPTAIGSSLHYHPRSGGPPEEPPAARARCRQNIRVRVCLCVCVCVFCPSCAPLLRTLRFTITPGQSPCTTTDDRSYPTAANVCVCVRARDSLSCIRRLC